MAALAIESEITSPDPRDHVSLCCHIVLAKVLHGHVVVAGHACRKLNKKVNRATLNWARVEQLIRNDPTQALTRPAANKKPKPNAPCSCGSGKKYKKCYGSNK